MHWQGSCETQIHWSGYLAVLLWLMEVRSSICLLEVGGLACRSQELGWRGPVDKNEQVLWTKMKGQWGKLAQGLPNVTSWGFELPGA